MQNGVTFKYKGMGDNSIRGIPRGDLLVQMSVLDSDGYTRKKYISIKLAMYLDTVTVNTGCLRVIPGSHHVGDVFAEFLQEASRNSNQQKQEVKISFFTVLIKS